MSFVFVPGVIGVSWRMDINQIKQAIIDSDGSDWLYFDTQGRYTLATNPDIHMKRIPDPEGRNEQWEEEWVRNYPDKKAYRQVYLLYFRSSLIDEIDTVVTDGGRYVIPVPDIDSGVLTLDSYKYALGTALNSARGGYSFDDGLRTGGISVI